MARASMRVVGILFLVAAAHPAAAAENDWSSVDSPNGGAAQNRLAAVACTSNSDCWAVGKYSSGGGDKTLIERWDGTAWTVVPSPNVSRTQDELTGVSCVSPTDCWAVGHTFNNTNGAYQTLILRWDGESWAVAESPNPESMFNFLLGVTCASASDCWAVGDYYRYEPSTGRNVPQTLILRWDGASWTIAPSPNAGEGQYNFLTGVTCASPSSCFAVGTYAADLAYQNLILRWDGTSWIVVPSPNDGVSVDNSLYGVTCTSASSCFAVGIHTVNSTYRTLIERWNGTSWSIIPSPSPSGEHNLLTGVDCVSASDCWAVGYKGSNASTHDTLIERWNGASWTIVASPNTSSTRSDQLLGIACSASSECSAVGVDDGAGYSHTLVERWNGASWTILDTPDGAADPPAASLLNGVTCASASDCWAVGSTLDPSGTPQTLIARADGASWKVVRSPNVNPPGTPRSQGFEDVACASMSSCWAVGSFDAGLTDETLIEHWDGTSWSVAASPGAPASTASRLTGVTCASGSACWAVGSSSVAGVADQALIERWDGTSWALVDTPPVLAATKSALSDVACVSVTNCWAVGSASAGGVVERVLIERWDGASWTVFGSPNPVEQTEGMLTDVTCVSASDCWAVGRSIDGDGVERTLVERWNGTTWAVVPSPNTDPTADNALSGISCVSSSECWAVGSQLSGSIPRTLILRWDGTAWSVVGSPNIGDDANHIRSVTCTAPPRCWGVGSSQIGSVAQTLVLRYAPAADAAAGQA